MRALSGLPRVMMSMVRNVAPGEEVFVAVPREKRAVVALERKGLVSVRRTDEKCAGERVWWFKSAEVSS